VCKEAETCAEGSTAAKIKGGGEKQERHRVSPREIVEVNFDGRLKEGASREELYHARMKRANEDEAREKRARGRKKYWAKEISKLSEVFKGERQDGRCG